MPAANAPLPPSLPPIVASRYQVATPALPGRPPRPASTLAMARRLHRRWRAVDPTAIITAIVSPRSFAAEPETTTWLIRPVEDRRPFWATGLPDDLPHIIMLSETADRHPWAMDADGMRTPWLSHPDQVDILFRDVPIRVVFAPFPLHALARGCAARQRA